MYELALFAGAGGGILGGKLCGFTCIGAVEIEPYPRKVLLQRQRDGILGNFPIWDDVTTFRIDNPDTREYIELLKSIRKQLIISGGFPCQDISSAGKGKGIEAGTRSGLWFEMARIIDEIKPAKVLVENSPVLTSRGLGIVLGDLAKMGYDAQWGVLGAVDVGAPHKRERIWIVANPDEINSTQRGLGKSEKQQPCNTHKLNDDNGGHGSSEIFGELGQTPQLSGSKKLANSDSKRQQELDIATQPDKSRQHSGGALAEGGEIWWTTEPQLGRVANGVACRVDRLKSIGNGQVPAVVKAAWDILK